MDPLASSLDFFVLERSIAFSWSFDFNVPGLVYHPHPETKARHWQCSSVLEILAPFIGPVYLNQQFEHGVNPTAIQVVRSSS